MLSQAMVKVVDEIEVAIEVEDVVSLVVVILPLLIQIAPLAKCV